MPLIEFTITYNIDETATVSISHYWGNSYQLIINRFYEGLLTKRDGTWILQCNVPTQLTSDDIQALGQRIDEELSKL